MQKIVKNLKLDSYTSKKNRASLSFITFGLTLLIIFFCLLQLTPAGRSSMNYLIVSKDCAELFDKGYLTSGIYEIRPFNNSEIVKVYCDMIPETNQGWIVIQKRYNGQINFKVTFKDYEDGFGTPLTEFWFGLKNLYDFTKKYTWNLRIDLEDFGGNREHIEYKNFKIDKGFEYSLQIGDVVSGEAGDSLSSSRGHPFLAPYRDPQKYSPYHSYGFDDDHKDESKDDKRWFFGAWWVAGDHQANLNAFKYVSEERVGEEFIYWKTFRSLDGEPVSLKSCQMKIRKA